MYRIDYPFLSYRLDNLPELERARKAVQEAPSYASIAEFCDAVDHLLALQGSSIILATGGFND